MASSFFKAMDRYLHHGLRVKVKVVLAFSLGAHSSRESTSSKMIVAVLLQPSYCQWPSSELILVVKVVVTMMVSFSGWTGVLVVLISVVEGNGQNCSMQAKVMMQGENPRVPCCCPTWQEVGLVLLPLLTLHLPWKCALQYRVGVKVHVSWGQWHVF